MRNTNSNINKILIFILTGMFLCQGTAYSFDIPHLRVPIGASITKERQKDVLGAIKGSDNSVSDLRDDIKGLINRRELRRFTAPLKKLAGYENYMREFALQLGIDSIPSKRDRYSFIVEEMLIELAAHRLGQESRLDINRIAGIEALRPIYLRALELARYIENA